MPLTDEAAAEFDGEVEGARKAIKDCIYDIGYDLSHTGLPDSIQKMIISGLLREAAREVMKEKS